ncbi:hypothetical protein SLA2020_263240 [Shorea laevis]
MLLLSVQRHETPHSGRLQGPGGHVQEGLETEKKSVFAQEEEATDDEGPVVVSFRPGSSFPLIVRHIRHLR